MASIEEIHVHKLLLKCKLISIIDHVLVRQAVNQLFFTYQIDCLRYQHVVYGIINFQFFF